MINWKLRFKNPAWVVSFFSQILILAQLITGGLNQIGFIHFSWTDQFNTWLLAVINAVLVILSMLGIVQDPTTKGYADSERAKKYTEPK
ncbi:phage holin [Pseudobacillus wudalianchiensis]|uniref:Phage holin n=1 Tax=Pseudobacillus wudalianchiensis TaxID=1743143 RepID=A0A1B9ATR4_9BACI|nr:phage holin [Bacillus wudalianchiensis]OCA87253.1 phage holin [Bacillus wudalianchiensis]